MRLLVTGGRKFNDRAFIYQTLDALHAKTPISVLVHGAARGADTLCGEWAISRGVAVEPHPAKWAVYGRRAGPLRNIKMIETKPDLLVAFPGGTGTAGCVKEAKKRKGKVYKAG